MPLGKGKQQKSKETKSGDKPDKKPSSAGIKTKKGKSGGY